MSDNKTKAKLIEYAYPSSIAARKAGYDKTGCWFVRLYPSVESCFSKEVPLFYTADKDKAIAYAETLPNPYNHMHKYFNQ